MSKQYPYIPRDYYQPVMFACKMIREKQGYTKAINIAAKYYGVDRTELERFVRGRQAAGQKGTTRKYKWYAVQYSKGNEYEQVFMADKSCWDVVKAMSEDKAMGQIRKGFNTYGTNGFDGEWPVFGRVKEFETKEDAKAYIIKAGAYVQTE